MSVADLLTIVTAGVEYRQSDHGAGLVLSGPVVNYNEFAATKRGRETVRPGAFLGLADPNLPVTFQHRQQSAQRITNGAGLTFRDTETALYADLVLPDSAIGRAAADGVRNGELTGWSTEFMPLIETPENGAIAVYRALMVGLGLVDVPAYRGSLVVLNRGGGGSFQYDRPIVTRDRGKRRKEAYRPTVFADTIEQNIDVLLYLRETGRGAVASTAAGTLILTNTPTALQFEVTDFPNTTAAADFVALAESESLDFGVIPLVTIPPPDVVPNAYEDIPEPGNPDVLVRWYNNVTLHGLLITNSAGVNQGVGDVMLNARRLAWL